MTESEFERLADDTLRSMVEQLANLEDEQLDAELESGVLTITFDDDSAYVVNSHRAAAQIWMSADSRAWHFRWAGDRWLSTKSDDELWTTLNERLSTKLGRPIRLNAN